jgi:hypothetical protein
MKTNTHFLLYLSQFFLEWEVYRTKFVEEIKTRILYSVSFFENRSVYVEKVCTAGHATDDNMAHAYCVLDT